MSVAHEAGRQQALLAALWSPSDEPAEQVLRESGARAAQGLSAYRANAAALADRALGAVFGTVKAMLGDEDFKHLAREFWRAHPPQRGDLGEWGQQLPAWLQAHTALDEWPWLGDCARLDLALHQCERAADAELDVASLGLMETADPDDLRIVLMPGTAAWSSRWPLATIHRAHALRTGAGAGAEAGFADVRAALAEQRGEHVLVTRTGWRARVQAIEPSTLAWTQLLLDETPLGTALQRAEGFDFAEWLATALREGWLKEVVRRAD